MRGSTTVCFFLFLSACIRAPQTAQIVTLQIVNDDPFITICEVKRRAKGEMLWSANLLGEHAWLSPGERYVTRVQAGRCSLQMLDCRNRLLYHQYDLDIAGNFTIRFGPIWVPRHPRYGSRRLAK